MSHLCAVHPYVLVLYFMCKEERIGIATICSWPVEQIDQCLSEPALPFQGTQASNILYISNACSATPALHTHITVDELSSLLLQDPREAQ